MNEREKKNRDFIVVKNPYFRESSEDNFGITNLQVINPRLMRK